MMPIKMTNFLFDSLDVGLNILILSERGIEEDYLFQDLMWDFHGKTGTRVLISGPNNQVPDTPESMFTLQSKATGDAAQLIRSAIRMNPTYIFANDASFCATELLQAMDHDVSVVASAENFSDMVTSAMQKAPHLSQSHMEQFVCDKVDLIVRIEGNEFTLEFPWYDKMSQTVAYGVLLETKGREVTATPTPLKPSAVEKVLQFTSWYVNQTKK